MFKLRNSMQIKYKEEKQGSEDSPLDMSCDILHLLK